MTDKNHVHYIIIVDRSGSMHSIREDTEGGVRSFIAKQLEGVDGNKRTVSFYQFDDRHDLLYDYEPLEKAKDYTLVPRGWTALLDAVGTAITATGEKIAAMPERKRPGQVMVVIATDGQENHSREYKRSQIKEMIEHQQSRYNWKFTYVGANQDAFAEAQSIGIRRDSALNYVPAAASATWDVLATSASLGTVTTSAQITYSTAQRATAGGGGAPTSTRKNPKG